MADWNIPAFKHRRLSSLLSDPSVMDGYVEPQAQPQGLLDPAKDAIGPPSVLGGLLSLDPTDYIGPQTLGKLAAGLKGLLTGGAAVAPLAAYMGTTLKRGAQSVPNRFNQSGQIAWHGSPHKFDKFSLDKIGTGEGAQAYGHGLYLAEAPEVALEYQKKLSSTGGAKNLAAQYGGVDDGIAEATRRIDHYNQLIANGGGGDMRRAKGMLSLAQKNLEDLSAMKAGLPENTGNLYKTDIPDEAVARFLDWDKPLSQQAPEVQKKLAEIAGESADSFSKKMLTNPSAYGEDLHKALTWLGDNSSIGADRANAAEILKKQGIPGIRYLDGGSRNTAQRWIAKHPQGGENTFNTQAELDAFVKRNPEFKAIAPDQTSNFVAFDPEMIRILERNGQPTGQQPWGLGEWLKAQK